MILLLVLSLFINIYADTDELDAAKLLSFSDNVPNEILDDNNYIDNNITDDEIKFLFKQTPITEIVSSLAKHKKINIVLPQNAADLDAIKKQTITYRPMNGDTTSINEAWDLLISFLNLSGFGIFKKDSKNWIITKLGKKDTAGIQQGTLPFYIDSPISELPKAEIYIRYIGYLRNLQVPTGQDDNQNPIIKIISSMKSPGAADPIYDPKSNAIILTDKSDIISSIMNIIRALDSTGFRDTISVLQLNNVPAAEVADVFAKLKAASGRDLASPFIRPQRADSLSSFAADTTVLADNRLNALILMGRESAVNRIENFVSNYIDVEPETGNSILHTYDLQYLNSKDFVSVLDQIIRSGPTESQGTQAPSSGSTRFFEGAVVFAEGFEDDSDKVTPPLSSDEARVTNTGTAQGEIGITGPIYKGGNRLLVAATQSEWEKIKKIIEMVDHPEPQVILECYIVDFTNVIDKTVAGTMRNPTGQPFNRFTDGVKNPVQILASHITAPQNVLGPTPVQLAQDLLSLTTDSSDVSPLTSLLPNGALIFSFNDPNTPGIWGLLQILQDYTHMNVIAHPFLISTNNKRATITSEDVKRGQGNVVSTGSGSLDIQVQDITASIQVQMIPHLSSLDRLNLQVAVDINQFVSSDSLNRSVRRVNTDAILNTGQIFVIGGLNEYRETVTKTKTPILGDIPIIGRLFSGEYRTKTAHNFMVFISPTIVPTKLRSGLNIFTTDKIRRARRDVSDIVIYGPSKDPVTRLFFGEKEEADNSIKDYLLSTTNAPKFSEIETGKERKRAASRMPSTIIKQSAESITPNTNDIIV